MSLRIRRGTAEQRLTTPVDLGEIVWTTDTNKLYVGDGVNLGGKNILATSAGTGLIWNATTQRLDFNGSGSGIINVQADATPSLGGNLNLNSRNITGTGNITITGTLSVTGLGGNLNLNGRTITGTGNIDIAGAIASSVTVGPAINATSTAVAPAITSTSRNSPALHALSSINPAIRLEGITDGQFNVSRLEIDAFKGTVGSKTNTVAGDSLGGLYVRGYYNNTYIVAAGITSFWNQNAQLNTSFPASTLLFFANGNGNVSNVATFDGSAGIFNAPIVQTTVYSVIGTALPSAATMGAGARAFVSDATVNTFATAYTGGGTNKVPVYSDGTVWRIG